MTRVPIGESRYLRRLKLGLWLGFGVCALGLARTGDWRALTVIAAAWLFHVVLNSMNPRGLSLEFFAAGDWRLRGAACPAEGMRIRCCRGSWAALAWLECCGRPGRHFLLFADALDPREYRRLRRGLRVSPPPENL